MGGFLPLQSEYRKFHGTETALLKATDDVDKIMDDLDVSAAFSTVDHELYSSGGYGQDTEGVGVDTRE
ncbi:unnamed protein product [Lampetra fluviatilis]